MSYFSLPVKATASTISLLIRRISFNGIIINSREIV